MFCRKALFLAGLTLCVIDFGFCQVVTSAQNGFWHDPSTWEGGIVPNMENSSSARIAHAVEIASDIQISGLEVSGSLMVLPSGSLDLMPPPGGGHLRIAGPGYLRIQGTLTGRDSVQYETTAANVSFESGSRFLYLGGSRGFIPMATWDPESTFQISGFAGSGYIAIAFRDSWLQTFGHVVYDCPLQTSFVDLNGYLRSIQGDLVIRHTNNQSLRLSTSQRPLIRIGGDFRIEGPSEVWVTTTSDSARLDISGDFEYRSSSTGPSYLTTRGRCHVNVGGKMLVDAAGPMRMCSGSVDSTGVRRTTLQLRGGLEVIRGSFIAPFPGKGILSFAGPRQQHLVIPSSAFSGNIDFYCSPESVVDIGTSEFRNDYGDLHVKGHLKLGSSHPLGALHHGSGGNFQIAGEKKFYPGAIIEYNGSAPQAIGPGHPDNSSVNLVVNTPAGVVVLDPLAAANVDIVSGDANFNSQTLRLSGDLVVGDDASVSNAGVIELDGAQNTFLSLNGSEVHTLVISKSVNTDVVITSQLLITGLLSIVTPAVTLHANGNLTLVSRSDDAGYTARVAPLPEGSRIEGNVTVQRYMSGEGRLYRYIASPVMDATVDQLMDDFPVTGPFADPSTGQGIQSSSPSLYYYDRVWTPFPVSGMAAENILQNGRGYAAFVRGGATPIVWDLTGILNQGSFDLPVTYHDIAEDPHRGWNLVGNPYASPIEWGGGDGWIRDGIGEAIAVRDNGQGRFRYFDGAVGDLTDGLIASGQAFWTYALGTHAKLVVSEHAKSSTDAAFFRQGKRETDYLKISLEGPGVFDHAFVRKRAEAGGDFDRFDALKIANEKLSLSILSADSVPVAIYASDTVPCLAYFPLQIAGVPLETGFDRIHPGEYFLTVEASGLFSHSEVEIVDHFKGDTAKAPFYAFTVTQDPNSASPHRFSVGVKTHGIPNPGFTLAEFACSDSVASIHIGAESPAHARYSAHIGAFSFSNEDDTSRISVPMELLRQNEPQSLTIIAKNICREQILDSLTLRLPVAAIPLVSDGLRCGPGSVTLQAQPAEGTEYFWYADENRMNLVARGHAFTTPSLRKSATFFLVSADSADCESEVVPVVASIVMVDSLVIRQERNVLVSKNDSTMWFRSNTLLHKGAVFEPDAPGVYIGRLSEKGCTSEAAVAFTNSTVSVFPVPFRDVLRIVRQRSKSIHRVEVCDLQGRRVGEDHSGQDEVVLRTEHWPEGTFFVHVYTATGIQTIKVMKVR